MKRRDFTALAAAASLLPAAYAQSDKTIRLLVGFPPGGSIDIVSRVLAEKMKDDLKANILIENRAGAGGRVAADLLKAAPADGSVVMITPIVVPVLAPLVFSKLNYNPATDFAPVGHVCNFNFALSVPASLPVKNVTEFVTWLKANPQKANFGSPAPGSGGAGAGGRPERDPAPGTRQRRPVRIGARHLAGFARAHPAGTRPDAAGDHAECQCEPQ